MAQQLEQIETQWCSHAKQAHEQSEASIKQGNPVDRSNPAKANYGQLEALLALPTSQARLAVRGRLLKNWVAQLREQGDPRSLATAAFLVISTGSTNTEGWAENASAFQTQALQTNDPYIWNLWQSASRSCVGRETTCRTLPETRWAEIEPGNLLAWLADFQNPKRLSEAQWRGVEAARYVRDYQFELKARLLALLAKTPPGLELEIGLELVELSSPRDSMGAAAFILEKECIKHDASSQHRNICLGAAALFWNAPQHSLLRRLTALSVGMKLNPLGDADWAGRWAEIEALSPEMIRALDQAESEPEEWRKAGCDKLQMRRQRLLDIAEGGTWKAAQTLLAKGAAR